MPELSRLQEFLAGAGVGAKPQRTRNTLEALVRRDPGEAVWVDDSGVTCRRWNWRQARRTQLSPETTSALFILDALDPLTDQALKAAADALVSHLQGFGDDVRVARRLITATTEGAGPC